MVFWQFSDWKRCSLFFTQLFIKKEVLNTYNTFVQNWWLETNCFRLFLKNDDFKTPNEESLNMDSSSFFFELLTKKNEIDVILKTFSVQNWTPTVSNCFPDFYKYTLRIQNVHRERIPARRNETIAVRRVGVRRGVLRRRDVDRYSLLTWKRLVFFLRNILRRWILVRGFDVFVARARALTRTPSTTI